MIKDFIVDTRERTARGIWKGPEQRGGRSRQKMAIRLDMAGAKEVGKWEIMLEIVG